MTLINKSWEDFFPDSATFGATYQDISKYYGTGSEFFNQQYVLDLTNDIMYLYFSNRFQGRITRYPDQFMRYFENTFALNWPELYTKMLPYIARDLNTLKDKKERGKRSENNTDFGNSGSNSSAISQTPTDAIGPNIEIGATDFLQEKTGSKFNNNSTSKNTEDNYNFAYNISQLFKNDLKYPVEAFINKFNYLFVAIDAGHICNYWGW